MFLNFIVLRYNFYMEEKTNVMRILDKSKIAYHIYNYDAQIATTGALVAKILNQNANQVFKTLVLTSKSKKHYVFMLPVEKELDMKKCAKAVDEKNVEMLPQKELFDLTGYVHGGCSPIGQKKKFKTIIDISAKNFDTIIFSAGKVGWQVEVDVLNLQKLIDAKFFEIIA